VHAQENAALLYEPELSELQTFPVGFYEGIEGITMPFWENLVQTPLSLTQRRLAFFLTTVFCVFRVSHKSDYFLTQQRRPQQK
jgi:hypothetical protein